MEGLHLAFLAYSAVCILLSDHLGFLYFIGKRKTLSQKTLTLLHRLVWVGLLGMIVSGIFLVLPTWDFYITYPAFQLKMAFVGVLIINGLFIGRLLHTSTHTPYKDLTGSKKILLLLSGAASATGWIASTLIGFLWL